MRNYTGTNGNEITACQNLWDIAWCQEVFMIINVVIRNKEIS